jgi:lipopolysaccharide transport system ATP-binding protein
MSTPIIRVDNLSKRYHLGGPKHLGRTFREALVDTCVKPWRAFRGYREEDTPDLWALKDVSFEVEEGEIVGIIGRNGAGKSTLLKVLSRIVEPTTGRIGIDGRLSSLLEVGTGFHPELTGRENIFLNGAILGMARSEIRRKFDDIVAFAEVERFLDTAVKHYSSGMYVRLAFAVAAHLEPEILVIDEVLAVGDAAFQKKCLGKMGEVAKGGRTVLFVSHNMHAISQLTTSIILLEQGQVVFRGQTPEGVARYTAGVFGEQSLGQPYKAPPKKTGVHLAAVRVLTSSPHGEHICGQPIQCEFDLRISEEREGLCFSFQVCDEMNRPACHFWLLDCGADFRQGPGVYRLQCSIPKFRLYLGRYTLTTWLTDRRGGALLEKLSEICAFEVSMRGHRRAEYDWVPGAMVYWEDCEWASVAKQDSSSESAVTSEG